MYNNIGIFGLGTTGISVLNFFSGKSINIYAWDDNISKVKELSQKYPFVNFVNFLIWPKLDFLILSPGIKLYHNTHPVVLWAKKQNIPLKSDLDLYFDNFSFDKNVAITGTNGKSTTTSLTHFIVKSVSEQVQIAGNIGFPILNIENGPFTNIFELSSYQLELSAIHRFNISALLNITPDHLDHHGSMENYAIAKKRILAGQLEQDFSIIGIDGEISAHLADNYPYKARLVKISAKKTIEMGISCVDNVIYDNYFNFDKYEINPCPSMKGKHNAENIATSFAICSALGMRAEDIIKAINLYNGLPHRNEYLGNYQGVNYYNDSKATNADSTSKALESLDNIHWIVGGVAKDGGIDSLEAYFPKIIKAYLIGESSKEFSKVLSGKINYELCQDLDKAFDRARTNAREGENILLSPACASFDQWKNYEERGEFFRNKFKNLK